MRVVAKGKKKIAKPTGIFAAQKGIPGDPQSTRASRITQPKCARRSAPGQSQSTLDYREWSGRRSIQTAGLFANLRLLQFPT